MLVVPFVEKTRVIELGVAWQSVILKSICPLLAL
jgi:hypothetical protein